MTKDRMTALLERVFEEARIPRSGAAGVADVYTQLVGDIVAAREARGDGALVYGLCGSQGSGKSTMTQGLDAALREFHGLSVAVLSLDDLYLSSEDRGRLAREVHPLYATRGVPGTHDVALGMRVLRSLREAGSDELTRIPRFDKARDEPCEPAQWTLFRGRADVVIFEGWCVGARPQGAAALVEPINELERTEDSDGRWRRSVDEQLEGPYRNLFGSIDRLTMIRAPSFEVVLGWRREQEHKLAARVEAAGSDPSASRVMTDAQLRRFVMHYERITRHLLAEMPRRADVVVRLDEQRRIVGVDFRGR